MNKENEDIAYLLLEDKSTQTDERENSQAVDPEIAEFVNVETPRGNDQDGGPERKKRKYTPYQTIAVKPSSAVVPMLQNLLNPFVMGISKSARQVSQTSAFSSPFLFVNIKLISRPPRQQLKKRHQHYYRERQRQYRATYFHRYPTHFFQSRYRSIIQVRLVQPVI